MIHYGRIAGSYQKRTKTFRYGPRRWIHRDGSITTAIRPRVIRLLQFDDRKYGFPLDMDLHRYQENPDLHLPSQIHTIDFFEIMFLEVGTGHFWANQFKVPVGPRTILFASPYQLKRYDIPEESVRGFHLVFRSSFLETFFADRLFVHRLHYFFNVAQPPYLVLSEADFTVVS